MTPFADTKYLVPVALPTKLLDTITITPHSDAAKTATEAVKPVTVTVPRATFQIKPNVQDTAYWVAPVNDIGPVNTIVPLLAA